ncbi:MAG: GNAT family N-acetyltransferase [Pseudomonadota bacterium]|uniref:GNAT family N-acetyltransferase n=1 Tax=Paraburkholderia TaxID=1822464 RepID=UPI0001440D61|nr:MULTISPECIES: GNAT family N-acetyltransferase [Paraburkholderia]USU14506.1 GNAT family N-acetyltransferase [Paraburkholderia fungorum]USU22454.1 GNAT family N-acetyltransferase [Paraburkholderia fungorum]
MTGPWSDPAAHERFLEHRIETGFGEGLGYWSIFPKQDPRHFLGWVLLIPYDAIGPEIEIGWRLARKAWGHGYATKAALPIATHALYDKQLPEIVADIHAANVASMRVAEKVGMRDHGQSTHDGMPSRRYRMTRQDYLRQTIDPVREIRR